jgi:hypothetical protein
MSRDDAHREDTNMVKPKLLLAATLGVACALQVEPAAAQERNVTYVNGVEAVVEESFPDYTITRRRANQDEWLVTIATAKPKAAEADFDIPSGDLEKVLRSFVYKAGGKVTFTASGSWRPESPGVKGRLPAREALDRLLSGTGQSARDTPEGYWLSPAGN